MLGCRARLSRPDLYLRKAPLRPSTDQEQSAANSVMCLTTVTNFSTQRSRSVRGSPFPSCPVM